MASEKKNPVNWFEIPAKKLERAQDFYENVLGLKLSRTDMEGAKMALFPMANDSPGSAGSLVEAETYEPSSTGPVVYFSVESIESTLSRVEDKGGKVLEPKKSIGEHGFVAVFQDCEGNRMALHSMS